MSTNHKQHNAHPASHKEKQHAEPAPESPKPADHHIDPNAPLKPGEVIPESSSGVTPEEKAKLEAAQQSQKPQA